MTKKPTPPAETAPQEIVPPTEATTLAFGDFKVEVSALPESTVSRLLAYGFGKMLQDAASGTVKRVTALGEAFAKGTTNDEETKEWEAIVKEHGSFLPSPEAYAKAVAHGQQSTRFKAMLEGTLNVRASGAPRVVGDDKLAQDAAKEILAQKAKAKGAKLPKADSDEYKIMLGKVMVAYAEEIAASVQAKKAAAAALAAAIKDDDIFG